MRIVTSIATAALALWVPGALAQDNALPDLAEPPEVVSVLDGDYIVVGAGVALAPSYDGSDDYRVRVLPLVQGSLGGVGFSPRGAGLELDLIDDPAGARVTYSLGPTARLRSNRSGNVKDEVVRLLPKLDRAIEIGPSAGVALNGVLHGYDRISLSSDIKWDVAGAHDGMTISPSVSYLTPLSRGIVTILSVSTEYVDDDYAEYYYSVTPEAATVTGLPAFEAEGGFTSAGVSLLAAVDLNGDVTDGGFAIAMIGSYSRMLGDAKDTPFTRLRGSADQWFGGAGLTYTF